MTVLVLLAAVATRIWYLLLVRLVRGEPSEVGWWLAVAFGLILVGRAQARRDVSSVARPWRRWLAAIDGPALLMLAFAFVLVWLFDLGFERAASDGREYFVQVRSLVLDWDLDFANEAAVFGVRGTSAIYAFGAPLLWAPFFVAAHVTLGLANLAGADFVLEGYSNPYQRAIGFGTLVYGVAGLWLIFRLLSSCFTRGLAAAATIAVTSASFLLWYLTIDNSMVHGVSMFATTLFLYVWHRSGRQPTPARWAAMGAAAGLMTLVRWQNALFAVLPLALLVWDAIRQRASGSTAKVGWRATVANVALFGAAGAAVFLPQLAFWKVVRGGWLAVPAAEHGVGATGLHVADVLFSANHGLLSWSPVVYLALPGLAIFARRNWRLALVLAAGFVAQLYINSAVDVWWGGAGFGARRFANSTLVFAVGLAAVLDWTRRRPLAAPVAVLAVLAFLNATLMLDVRGGRLPASEGITFDRMLDSAYERVGNPFSFPMNAWVAWRYGAGPTLFDQLGSRTYTDLLIDIGTPGDAPFLTSGWFDREEGADASFRWSSGPASSLVVPLREPADYVLDLRCTPFTYPGAPTQTLDVIVNGRPTARFELAPGWNERRVELAASTIRPDLNLIELRYGYSRSPRDSGTGDDPRELAAACDWIRLTRQ